MNEFQTGAGPVVFLAKDGCGKELVLDDREETYEGLAGRAGSVCNETPRTTIRNIYADRVQDLSCTVITKRRK